MGRRGEAGFQMGCCRTCGVSSEGEKTRVALHQKGRDDGGAAGMATRGRKIASEEDYHSWLLADVEENKDRPQPSIFSVCEGGVESAAAIRWRRWDSLELGFSPSAQTLIRFSYNEIRSATRDFHSGRLLGRGALSRVYRGEFAAEKKGRRIFSMAAVKRLQGEKKECGEAFCREIAAANLRHRNLIPLLGFCVDPQGLFLVYKFAQFGSLDQILHPVIERENEEGEGRRERERKGGDVLSWEVRWKVAVGVGRALAYLQHGTKNCVIHRDIKPANILLSSSNTPMLSDFGMSLWTRRPSLPIFCKTVEGTFGYLAPEYFQHGKLSEKTDVFSFGVVLLELITGRKPIDHKRSPGDQNLLLWAKPILRRGRGAMEALLDPRLKNKGGSFSRSKLWRMVRTAAACLSDDDATRPSIGAAMEMLLRGELELPVFPGDSPQLQSDMTGHLKLAMEEVSRADDET